MPERNPTADSASILIVDDTPANLRLLTELLSRSGYRVRSAISGSLALTGAIAQPPDLVMLDIMMPEMNGYEVCQHLKANQRTREVPVIFLSALEDAADKVKAFEVGGADYISKPFQKAEVLARVENQLGLRRLQLQLSAQNEQLQAEVRERAIAQQQLQQFSANLKQIHRLDTSDYASDADRYADYLQTGCQLLQLELGALSRISDDQWNLEAQHAAVADLTLPATAPLAETCCKIAIAQQRTLAIPTADELAASEIPPTFSHGQVFNTYLSTPIWVGHQIYGTLCFADRQRRPTPFAEREIESVELIAESLGKFLAARQEERKRQRAEEETRLLLAIARAIAEAPDFETALAVALNQVSEASGWSYAEVWLPSPDGQVLVSAPVWYGRDRQRLADFQADNADSTRRPGEGLVGRVWATAAPEFIADLTTVSAAAVTRQAQILAAGFGAGLGVPILADVRQSEPSATQSAVLAVLVFFRDRADLRAAAARQEQAVELAVAIAAQLGTVLQQKQSAAEQRAIFAAMNDLVLVRDRQGRCLKIMPTDTESLIRPAAEMLGKTLHEVMPQAVADRLLASIEAALDGQATEEVEYEIERDGRQIWLAASISPLDRDRVILVARDISERKQREEALQLIAEGTAEMADHNFFRAAARTLARVFRVRYVLVSRYEATAAGGQVETLAFWDGSDFRENFAYLLAGTPCQQAIDGQEQFWARDIQQAFPQDAALVALGAESYRGVPLYDSQERVIGHIALLDEQPMQRDRQTDLILNIFKARMGAELERALAADALQASEARNRAILSAIPDLMFRIRADGVYLGYVKTRDFVDLLPTDYDPIGRHIREFLPPTVAVRHLKHLKQALATGTPQIYEQQVTVQNRIQYEEVRVVVSGPDEALFIVRDIGDRKRAELALRVAQQKSESLLLNILPRPIAERLKQQPEAIAEQFDETTILFADIVGFTPLAAQMSPIEVVNLLNQVFSEFDRLAEQFNLEKIKTIGDAYMLVGGVPTPQADHAIAVAGMALAMQAALARTSTPRLQELHGDRPLQMRIGIHTGSVVAGVIGAKKFIYDLWGDAVNIASRMEAQGVPGRIQISAATYAQLDDRFQCEQRGEIEIRGRGKLATYWLLGEGAPTIESSTPLRIDA